LGLTWTLPKWLKVTADENVITFTGVPQESDIGEIRIQIFDRGDFILREFWIDVESKNQNSEENTANTAMFNKSINKTSNTSETLYWLKGEKEEE